MLTTGGRQEQPTLGLPRSKEGREVEELASSTGKCKLAIPRLYCMSTVNISLSTSFENIWMAEMQISSFWGSSLCSLNFSFGSPRIFSVYVKVTHQVAGRARMKRHLPSARNKNRNMVIFSAPPPARAFSAKIRGGQRRNGSSAAACSR